MKTPDVSNLPLTVQFSILQQLKELEKCSKEQLLDYTTHLLVFHHNFKQTCTDLMKTNL